MKKGRAYYVLTVPVPVKLFNCINKLLKCINKVFGLKNSLLRPGKMDKKASFSTFFPFFFSLDLVPAQNTKIGWNLSFSQHIWFGQKDSIWSDFRSFVFSAVTKSSGKKVEKKFFYPFIRVLKVNFWDQELFLCNLDPG